MAKERELTRKQSDDYVRDLMQKPKTLKKEDLSPGSLVFYRYDAKYKEYTFDRTPLVLVLRTSKKYVLGINFHWLPVSHRMRLVQIILEMSKQSIKKHNKLQFTYSDLKPLLRSLNYAPCVRLYIKNRISPKGVRIPAQDLGIAAKLKTETFTNGKYSAAQLFRMAKARKSKR